MRREPLWSTVMRLIEKSVNGHKPVETQSEYMVRGRYGAKRTTEKAHYPKTYGAGAYCNLRPVCLDGLKRGKPGRARLYGTSADCPNGNRNAFQSKHFNLLSRSHAG